MTTLEMMNKALETEETYISGCMRYSIEEGFHDDCNKPWNANAFGTINDIMELNNWKPLKINENIKKMTLRQIERKLPKPETQCDK